MLLQHTQCYGHLLDLHNNECHSFPGVAMRMPRIQYPFHSETAFHHLFMVAWPAHVCEFDVNQSCRSCCPRHAAHSPASRCRRVLRLVCMVKSCSLVRSPWQAGSAAPRTKPHLGFTTAATPLCKSCANRTRGPVLAVPSGELTPCADDERGSLCCVSERNWSCICRRRREDWDTAFHCLYSQLRDGECDAFYYVSPQVRGGFCSLSRSICRVACTVPCIIGLSHIAHFLTGGALYEISRDAKVADAVTDRH